MEGRAKCDTSLGRPEQTNKTMDARSRAERVLNSGGRLSHRGEPWVFSGVLLVRRPSWCSPTCFRH